MFRMFLYSLSLDVTFIKEVTSNAYIAKVVTSAIKISCLKRVLHWAYLKNFAIPFYNRNLVSVIVLHKSETITEPLYSKFFSRLSQKSCVQNSVYRGSQCPCYSTIAINRSASAQEKYSHSM